MAAAAPCPEESTVWAFVHAELSPKESSAIRTHLDTCAACRATTAMLARSLPAPAAAAETDATELDEGLASQMNELSAHVARDQIVAGKYRVEEQLGSGGMGYVVAALHQQLGTRVALKILHPRMMKEADARARFLREARIVARLRSPHVVRVSDVDTLDEVPFLVMELLEGNDLAAELRLRGSIPAPEAILYILQAAHALAEAHRNGVVHRDLKPANMFLTAHADGGARTLKLLDFGISKQLGRDSWADVASSTLSFVGTPRYMAPEQLTLGGAVDARADIWGLGVVLYQLIEGSLPFSGESIQAYVAGVMSGEPAPLSEQRDVPRGLEGVIERCLSKDPNARYASIIHLAQALAPYAPEEAESLVEEIVSGQALASTVRSTRRPVAPPPPPPPPRHRLVIVAAGAVVLLVVGLSMARRRAARAELAIASPTPPIASPSVAVVPPPAEAARPAPPPAVTRASSPAPRGTRPAAVRPPHAEFGSRE